MRQNFHISSLLTICLPGTRISKDVQLQDTSRKKSFPFSFDFIVKPVSKQSVRSIMIPLHILWSLFQNPSTRTVSAVASAAGS